MGVGQSRTSSVGRLASRGHTAMHKLRRAVRGAYQRVVDWGRRAGVLPHRPETWSVEAWTGAYTGGGVAFYGGLTELARYSLLAGYIRFWPPEADVQSWRVLDVGCGTGILRRYLDDVPFTEYVGVDLSPAAVATAEARGFPRSRFVVGDAAEIELGQFDVVVLNEVLYYVPEPRAFLESMRRRLTSSGIVLVSMWRHPGDRSLWRVVDTDLNLVDRVEARNRANQMNTRGWTVAAYRPPPG